MGISIPPPSLRELDETTLSALIEVMLLAAYSDGEFSRVEREHLERRIAMLAGSRFDLVTLARLRADAAERIAMAGRQARLFAVRETFGTYNERKVALAYATKMIVADGVVRTSERDFLGDMAEALEMDRDTAADLVRALTRIDGESA